VFLGSQCASLGPWRTEGYYSVLWMFSHPDVDDGKMKGASGFADIKLETTTHGYLSTYVESGRSLGV